MGKTTKPAEPKASTVRAVGPAANATRANTSENVERDEKTGERTKLTVPHEDPTTPEQKAENYFAEHPEYPHAEIVVTDDLVVFPGDAKGKNSADNYAKPRGIGSQVFAKA